ncbi:NB-ARC domain containing protein [Parasponia andersonii]|uniref:NB-ARC domain containing protein n=1 Tax=Parasponia andersonii TaxID=3476 RepID=A0A2P5CSF1_PARAD|nr:NB-ARC domain containing protein [Parasponia andersonii]
MAAPMLGGALLSASLQVLFDRLASREVVDFIRGKKLNEGLLKKLKIKLLSANAVLNDTDEIQVRNPAVNEWLDELKEAVFDAEDLMSEINTEALRCKLEGECTSKVLDLNSTSFLAFEKTRESKLVEVLDRLEYVLAQKALMSLEKGVQNKPLRKLPATSLIEESGVYGRDAEREAIINLLISDYASGDKASVIPIVGMGGIGKTTLAQVIYNDDRVKEHFDLKVWVFVSHEFDVFAITKTIFEAVTSQTCNIKDLNKLQVELKKALKEKRFLFVHDDVWNNNYHNWDVLKCPFESGAHGSKIIVTTRNERVASMMGNVPPYHLGAMTDEDCWRLFAKHAFNKEDLGADLGLEGIGRKIVRKCSGLPLAAKSLGGLLRFELNSEKWEKVLKSYIWELSDEESDILPALWLSYHYLPSHLKRCFAYCSIFPKDYEFTKKELISLWMAEDLLQLQNKKRIEEIGDEYFEALVSRSLFQQSSSSKLLFTMHDLVNDLAAFVSGKFTLRLEDSESPYLNSKTRYLSYTNGTIYDFKRSESLSEAKCLRTFLPLGWRNVNEELPQANLVLRNLLSTVQFLRVLSLFRYPITELPESIGNLKHLRYLDLSETEIREIPNSVCTLYNLQTLLLSCCRNLTQLPTNMGSLINLRRLDVANTPLKQMPLHMCRMKDLQALTDFVLGQNSGSRIKELRELQYLHGRLCISGLENVVYVGDVLEANLKDKKHLSELILKWSSGTNDSIKERQVLERLQPHTYLQKLSILCYEGTRFPNWIGDDSFSSIVSICLRDCTNCCLLPSLGQLPFLKELEISGFDGVVTVDSEFQSNGSSTSRSFKSLEILRFEDMSEWKQWSFLRVDEEGGVFPRLKELHLRYCPKLSGEVPDYLPSLSILRIWRCEQLKAIIPNSRAQQTEATFPSLLTMEIKDCPELESFLGGGLYSNLDTITISSCKKLFVNHSSWNMQRFTSIRSLHINNISEGVLDSFPDEGLLPTSLTSLSISDIANLRTLNGKGFQQLNVLEELSISWCTKLECLPEEGLPSSLSHLWIYSCPLLKERCERENGEDWPKISHIAFVHIDWELM